MKRLLNQAALLLLCFFSLPVSGQTDSGTSFLVSLLIALIFCSLLVLEIPVWACLLLSCSYLAAVFLLPELLFFLPLAFYCQFRSKKYGFLLLGSTLAAYRFLPDHPASLLYFFAVTLTALVLRWQTDAYEALDHSFRKVRDDSTEKNLLLAEKNKALLAQQDSEVYAATLKERNRIAREIHDNVGHMLSRSILMTGALKAINQDARMTVPLDQLEDTLGQAMTNIRTSVHDLRDESINLSEALQSLADTFAFCPLCLKYDMGFEVPREIKYAFITICREALNNIIRHSNATAVTLTALEHPGLYQLIIEDNGTQISLAPGSLSEAGVFFGNASSGGGCGLNNIRDRVNALNGILKIRTDNGFRIFITIPKETND